MGEWFFVDDLVVWWLWDVVAFIREEEEEGGGGEPSVSCIHSLRISTKLSMPRERTPAEINDSFSIVLPPLTEAAAYATLKRLSCAMICVLWLCALGKRYKYVRSCTHIQVPKKI